LGLLYAGSYDTPPDLKKAAHWLGLAAAAGNRIGQYGFAKLVLHGQGVERNPPRAIDLLERSAAQDYVPAMYLLGMVYAEGAGVPNDPGAGETWLRRAAIRGHASAACALARLLLDRPGDDGVEAAQILRDQAESGNAQAAAALADLYAFGRGVPRDAGEAERWRAVSETDASPATLTMLASMHVEGVGANQDFEAAVALLVKAAEGGSVDALYNLGSLYAQGLGVARDPRVAARYYRQAAKAGSAEAAFQLGLLYAGSGEADKHAAAAACFAHAAKGGHVQARANLGLLTVDGVGVARDRGRGLTLLREAAEAGDLRAQSALGLKLAAGVDGAPDHAAAREWLEKAAAAGDADAQAWMGDSQRLGLFGEPNFADAEIWYRQAAAQGHVGSLVLLATAIDSVEAPSPELEAGAFGLWLAAASAGDAEAEYQVGVRYRDGRGCEKDAETARRWLSAAAEKGHLGAGEGLRAGGVGGGNQPPLRVPPGL
jgi:TPR repeat protein